MLFRVRLGISNHYQSSYQNNQDNQILLSKITLPVYSWILILKSESTQIEVSEGRSRPSSIRISHTSHDQCVIITLTAIDSDWIILMVKTTENEIIAERDSC